MRFSSVTLTKVALVLTAGLAVQRAVGQVVFATDQYDAPQYLVDAETNRSYQVTRAWMYGGAGSWAMTADNALGVLYYSNAADLYMESAQALRPVYLGTIHDVNGPVGMVGLAWQSDAEVLYGASVFPESGIYEIDLTTLEATFVLAIDPVNNVGGLEYDNGTRSLLATFDGHGANGGGLYRIDVEQQRVQFITGYPDQNVTDIDGLAAGDGRAYLVSDERAPIYVYDLYSNTYLDPLASPVRNENVMCGAAWAPSFMNRLLISEPTPGVVHQSNRFHIIGAHPNTTVYVVGGFAFGNVLVPGCPGIHIEIAGPMLLGSLMTDEQGNGLAQAFVPPRLARRVFVYQAIDRSHCEISNLSAFQFERPN